MNRLAPFAFVAAILAAFAAAIGDLRAQSSELGALPPPPDLDLGDPEEEMSLREKLKANREGERRQREATRYRRKPTDTGSATLTERLAELKRQKARQQREERTTEITVENEVASPDDARTPTGSRLEPFGEEDFWGPMPEKPPEERLAVLPPMPDLRTPTQKTRRDRARERRLARFEQRKAEAKAKREEQERKRRATVRRPGPDPEDALVQVQSSGRGGTAYTGNREAPESVDGDTLKPFNQGSTYYDDGRMLYRGRKPDSRVKRWWQRGTTEQGGGEEEEDGSFFGWSNPFKETQDDVQEVAYTEPAGASRGHPAKRPSPDATPLTSNLRGIRVVPSTRQVSDAALSNVSGVSTEGVDLPPRVRRVLEARVGRPLSLGDLNRTVSDAVVAYRKSDMPVVDVLVPEQEVTGGVLQLVIIEGRLGDVIVEGAGRREGRALASQIRTERGEVIRESDLTEDLAWINKHPNRQVDLVFSPGRDYGETDVILRSQEYQELQAYLAYENSGTETLGENRALAGASWTGPAFFGLDSILSYQYTTNFADEFSKIRGHSGVFSSYLPWRHQLTLLGAYVDSEATIFGANGARTTTEGVNKQGSLRYGIPLPSIGRRTSHELQLGMDFKSSSSDLQFNQVNVFDTTSEIVQYSLGYNIVANDRTGVTTFDVEVFNSPGNATNKNTNAIFQTQRAGASADYTYGRATVERDQQLPAGWSAVGRLRGQASNSNLLSSETLGAGGYDTVRGFEQREAQGDNGVVGTLELRTPSFYPSSFSGFEGIRDGAYGLVFYDAAALSSEDPLPGELDRNLGSVGFGLRYQKEDWFTLRVDYGFQVTEEGFNDGRTGRWHVGARVTF